VFDCWVILVVDEQYLNAQSPPVISPSASFEPIPVIARFVGLGGEEYWRPGRRCAGRPRWCWSAIAGCGDRRQCPGSTGDGRGADHAG
jgi:hypothetical protein